MARIGILWRIYGNMMAFGDMGMTYIYRTLPILSIEDGGKSHDPGLENPMHPSSWMLMDLTFRLHFEFVSSIQAQV